MDNVAERSEHLNRMSDDVYELVDQFKITADEDAQIDAVTDSDAV